MKIFYSTCLISPFFDIINIYETLKNCSRIFTNSYSNSSQIYIKYPLDNSKLIVIMIITDLSRSFKIDTKLISMTKSEAL